MTTAYTVSVLVNDETEDPTLEGENPSRYETLAVARTVARRYVDMAQERGGFELIDTGRYGRPSQRSWRLVDEDGARVHILIQDVDNA